MRLRALSRPPARPADAGPQPWVAARPAVAPAWPDLPPVQRVVSAPSLVTAPEHFRQQLASWSNPSFLSTPGHLVTPDAPSGSVTGLGRPAGSAVSWDPPPSRWSDFTPAEEPTDDGPVAAPVTDAPAVQRA